MWWDPVSQSIDRNHAECPFFFPCLLRVVFFFFLSLSWFHFPCTSQQTYTITQICSNDVSAITLLSSHLMQSWPLLRLFGTSRNDVYRYCTRVDLISTPYFHSCRNSVRACPQFYQQEHKAWPRTGQFNTSKWSLHGYLNCFSSFCF